MKRILFFGALMGLMIPVLGQANLVTNGGFETGDFTGWTLAGNTGFTGVTGNFGGVNPSQGSFQAFFGPVGSLGGITQNIATTAGATYDISFDLANFGGTPTEYDVTFDGTTLVDVVNPNAFGYTTLSYTATATAASTALTFGFQQNPSYFLLDNVSVTAAATPEPSSYFVVLMVGLAGMFVVARRRRAQM